MERGLFQPVSEMLDSGQCEPLKAAVHGVVMVLAGICALYNTAAFVKRRQRHLALNAVFYASTVWVERCHVMHHLAACPQTEPETKVAGDLKSAA